MDFRAATPVVIGNHLLKDLPALELAAIKPHLKEFSPRPGTVLQEAGRGIETVFFPDTALVLLWVVLGNGNTVAAAMVGRDGAIGMRADKTDATALTRAVVQCPGKLFSLDAVSYRRLLSDCPTLRTVVARQADRMLAAAHQTVVCNAVHDVRQRLCRWLLDAHYRTDGGALLFTQETLARMLGVRRTTVTMVAGGLEQAGLIRQSRGRIEVIDLDGMQRVSCACSGVMPAAPLRHDALIA